MNKVTCGISMSLDAFVAGPNQSFENPFGDMPEDLLHHWMFDEPEKHKAELEDYQAAGDEKKVKELQKDLIKLGELMEKRREK
jgi:hypothetical protein